MRNLILSLAATLGLSLAGSGANAASIININFNDAGAGGAAVTLGNQFASDGIIFSNLVMDDFCGGYCGVVQNINVGGTQYNAPTGFSFEVGGQDAAADFISMTFSDVNIGSSLIGIELFGLGGVSLGSQSFQTPGSGFQTITVCASGCDITISAGIHEVVLTDPVEMDGTLLEALSFEMAHTPEPSTALSLALGLSGMAWLGRRKRA